MHCKLFCVCLFISGLLCCRVEAQSAAAEEALVAFANYVDKLTECTIGFAAVGESNDIGKEEEVIGTVEYQFMLLRSKEFGETYRSVGMLNYPEVKIANLKELPQLTEVRRVSPKLEIYRSGFGWEGIKEPVEIMNPRQPAKEQQAFTGNFCLLGIYPFPMISLRANKPRKYVEDLKSLTLVSSKQTRKNLVEGVFAFPGNENVRFQFVFDREFGYMPTRIQIDTRSGKDEAFKSDFDSEIEWVKQGESFYHKKARWTDRFGSVLRGYDFEFLWKDDFEVKKPSVFYSFDARFRDGKVNEDELREDWRTDFLSLFPKGFNTK